MPGLSTTRTAHKAVHGTSLTRRLVLLTVLPAGMLVALWALGAVTLFSEGGQVTDPGRADSLMLTATLGSLAAVVILVASVVAVLRYSRLLTKRLEGLSAETAEFVETGLPELVAQLNQSGTARIEDGSAARRHADDELARLGLTLQNLRRAVGEALQEQARGREGSEQVFLGLARRTQVLITRLIPKLDELERKHHDSELLKDVFAVDHLATRVRRHTENLVILGGSPPARRWTKPVPVYEVLRSAISETEDYRRVEAQPAPQLSLVGHAVADVVHLLAELIENGTSFSPPDTKVSVSASHVARGLALEVEDRGLGMPEEKYTHINALLSEQPRVDMMSLGETPRLGLFVVAQLARRHHLEVFLRKSHYGGTLAIVLLPNELLEETGSLLSNILPQDEQQESAPALPEEPAPAANPEPAGPFSATPPPPPEPLPERPQTVPAAAAPAAASMVFRQDGFPSYGGAGLLPGPSKESAPEHQPTREKPVPERAPVATLARPPARAESKQTHETPRELIDVSTPKTLPTRVRGQNLAEPLRRESRERDEPAGPPPLDRSSAIGAIQSANKRARNSLRDTPPSGRDTVSDEPGQTGSREF